MFSFFKKKKDVPEQYCENCSHMILKLRVTEDALIHHCNHPENRKHSSPPKFYVKKEKIDPNPFYTIPCWIQRKGLPTCPYYQDKETDPIKENKESNERMKNNYPDMGL